MKEKKTFAVKSSEVVKDFFNSIQNSLQVKTGNKQSISDLFEQGIFHLIKSEEVAFKIKNEIEDKDKKVTYKQLLKEDIIDSGFLHEVATELKDWINKHYNETKKMFEEQYIEKYDYEEQEYDKDDMINYVDSEFEKCIENWANEIASEKYNAGLDLVRLWDKDYYNAVVDEGIAYRYSVHENIMDPITYMFAGIALYDESVYMVNMGNANDEKKEIITKLIEDSEMFYIMIHRLALIYDRISPRFDEKRAKNIYEKFLQQNIEYFSFVKETLPVLLEKYK